ncbi:Cytochrome B5-like protein [Glycine soja]
MCKKFVGCKKNNPRKKTIPAQSSHRIQAELVQILFWPVVPLLSSRAAHSSLVSGDINKHLPTLFVLDASHLSLRQSFRICIMVLLVGLTLLLGLFLAVLLFNPRHRKSGHKAKAQASLNVDKASKSYSKTEVSLHNKRTDCWIIIKNKVYDVTSYVEEHPGGDSILAHAGDDSTEGFFGPQHATRVFDMIEDFYIGDLEQ